MLEFYIYIAVTIIMCNIFGQYFLVSTFDYLNHESTLTKFNLLTNISNEYKTFIRGILYTVPFYYAFGAVYPMYLIFANFMVWDFLESRHAVNHFAKEIFLYMMCVLYFFTCVK